MFVRDSLTAQTALQTHTLPMQLGDAMDDGATADVTGQDPLLIQLHQLALIIVQLRGEANAILAQVADAQNDSVNVDQLTVLMQQIAQYTNQFAQVAAQRRAQNPYALGWADQAMLDLGNWAQSFVNALPNAIAAIPNALVDALAKIIQNAGNKTVLALSPWVIGGAALVALVIFGTKHAETTRTYRKLVA